MTMTGGRGGVLPLTDLPKIATLPAQNSASGGLILTEKCGKLLVLAWMSLKFNGGVPLLRRY
jgi:hypothetical protein